MRILLLAPQPFYTERGTPIAVKALAEALCAEGHQVDLVVLHDGVDVAIPGMRLFRARRPPRVRRVPIGFSPAKLLCDVMLALTAFRLLRRTRYDAIHAVEEAVYPALLFKLLFRVPVIYDMDSLIVDQIEERWPWFARLRAPFDLIERSAIRSADLVLAVCSSIGKRARAMAPRTAVFLLPDIAEPAPDGPPPDGTLDLRAMSGARGLLALYVGNLEAYQGIGLLLAAFAGLPPHDGADACTLVIVGGSPDAIAAARNEADRLGLGASVVFTGPAPLAQLPWLLRQADILCSPRLKGVNTPMKIYSYMASGKPILATRIELHTQLLDEETAMLADPAPKPLAAGLATLIRDAALRERLGDAAARRARDHYGAASFAARLRAAYTTLAPRRYLDRFSPAKR